MHTKTVALISLPTILLLTLLLHGQTSPGIAAPGRYQLVSSPYTAWLKGNLTSSEQTIFKIDTQTGKTWKYMAGMASDGKLLNDWDPIRD